MSDLSNRSPVGPARVGRPTTGPRAGGSIARVRSSAGGGR